ncbi:MAG: 50S ribosomal protein L1 [Candidatus Cloacimonetes bacterium]|jgi:large subunit ribosomal protein L1|nr:50S ribosomal protein L1 [Candidatus Cloacimonadota bacterium]HOQ78548.1 50S ribosomal protein L1 [Candidatus Cloacimonas sp.]HPV64429.1 50S ribosomal protein L1 [Candidatus Cloacimonas sp.]HRR51308.1 50S ribosomal protein L1 [Candidatus Cloacimonas sp.]HRV10969.1 50S ribosomal protein L1 [Candidatus Cloacimonas sp.]
MKHSKRYNVAYSMFDRQKRLDLNEAVKLIKSLPASKFDETVEVHFNLGVDPRKADQQIRNSLVLPHGTGKEMRVLVFAEGDKAEEAKQAGADYVGVDDLIEKISGGWFDFDVVIATPNLMGRIGKLGRVLGPRGLMPNPKVGTVTMDVSKAVQEAKGGKVTYRVDKFGNLHIPAGRLSFDEDKLKENIKAIIAAVLRERPSTLKGIYIKSITLCTTMSPGIKIQVASATLEARS